MENRHIGLEKIMCASNALAIWYYRSEPLRIDKDNLDSHFVQLHVHINNRMKFSTYTIRIGGNWMKLKIWISISAYCCLLNLSFIYG